MKKPLVISHDSCVDGFAAQFAAWLKFGDDAEYAPMQYGNCWTDGDESAVDVQCLDRDVYILDFSSSRSIMDQVFASAKRVVWLDHHKTAFEMWCGGVPDGGVYVCNRYGPTTPCEIILNNNKSGAILAWEFFHPDAGVPALFRHIDDYDRWQFKLHGTKEINKALWSYAPWSFEQWEEYTSPQAHVWLAEEGAAVLRAHDQNVATVVKDAARKCSIVHPSSVFNFPEGNWPWVNGLAANCPPHLSSDVGHELAVQSGTFGLLWSIDKNNVCKCSLRSNGDYDVSAIAKAFGGGGHRNASGFEVPAETLLGWLK